MGEFRGQNKRINKEIENPVPQASKNAYFFKGPPLNIYKKTYSEPYTPSRLSPLYPDTPNPLNGCESNWIA